MVSNRKAQLKIFALIILCIIVLTGTGAVYMSVVGSMNTRAEFRKASLKLLNDMDGMKIFYSDMMRYASINALVDNGYDVEDFCPGNVSITDELREDIINAGENLVNNTYKNYKNYPLPHMGMVGTGEIGVVEIEAVGEEENSYLEIRGKAVESFEVNKGGINITSPSAFLTKISQTAEAEPEISLGNLQFRDSAGHIYTESEVNGELEAGKVDKVTVEVQNTGCAAAEGAWVEFYVNDQKVGETWSLDLEIGETKTPVEAWNPDAGSYNIRAESSVGGGVVSIGRVVTIVGSGTGG